MCDTANLTCIPFCISVGIRSWFAVTPPSGSAVLQSQDPLLGGVKVRAHFSGACDLQTIVESASRLGYQTPAPLCDLSE